MTVVLDFYLLSPLNEYQSVKMGSKVKSKLITYSLWLVGGILGLHHFYLGRDLHGFIWWCTFGGYFGFGWARDFLHIHEYVDAANEEKEYVQKMKQVIRNNKKPPFSCTRFTGMILVAYYWSSVYHAAIPVDEIGGINWKWLYILTPFVSALGVWAVGNIGHQTGGLKSPTIAAYLCVFLKYFMDESTVFTITVLAAAYAFDSFEKKWKPKLKSEPSCLWRMFTVGASCLLFSFMICSYIYFNAKISYNNEEEIPVREAFHHFLKSPWWTNLKQSIIDLWNFAQQHGWMETWRQMIEMSDPNGENHAYKVLELNSMASQAEINAKCRTLSVKFHPDKVQKEAEKKYFQEKFYEVQEACELLSSNRAKRRRKNKKFEEHIEL